MLKELLNREFINLRFSKTNTHPCEEKKYVSLGFLGKIKYYLKETGRRHPPLKDQSIQGILKYKSLQIITAPFIYLCFFPAILLDLVVILYQKICFPLYGIPQIKRKDYVIIDRYKLKYLNFSKKFNCVYCGYFTGVISYAQEIAGKTEQYWCPIKHATKLKTPHNHYSKFMDYGDATGYQEKFVKIRNFKEI
tara:strand:+ start:97 stop:675 length:579 start_codon:yes stop_codon:yes gene_type:complete